MRRFTAVVSVIIACALAGFLSACDDASTDTAVLAELNETDPSAAEAKIYGKLVAAGLGKAKAREAARKLSGQASRTDVIEDVIQVNSSDESIVRIRTIRTPKGLIKSRAEYTLNGEFIVGVVKNPDGSTSVAHGPAAYRR